MRSIPKRKALRKQQKHARKIQRKILKRRKNHSLGKRLSPEQKEIRCQQLSQRKEFKNKRRLLKNEKKEKEIIKRVEKALFTIFSVETLDKIAKSTGFIKRSGGEITAFSFMYIVSFGFFGNGNIALTYLVAGLNTHFNVIVTPQGLSKRINSVGSVKFLKVIFQKLIGIQLKIGLKNHLSDVFLMFKGIYLQDSTTIELNEELSEDFKGSGGAASKSALKVDFIYDILNYLVLGAKIYGATTNDLTNSKDILKHIKPGVLIVRDLGYFTIDYLRKIGKIAFYLTRLSISTNVYLNKNDDIQLDLPAYLKKMTAEGKNSVNVKIYVGKEERFETRLVAEKVPSDVVKQRTARYKKERKKVHSPYYEEWCNYSIFITNIPATMFSAKMIIELYKIRWQIELVFANFKSNVEVNILKGTNKNRIESLIYGKLITIVVIFIIHSYALSISKDKEVSGDKLTKILKSDNRLRLAIIKNDMGVLLLELEYDISLVCKQKRKRKTTSESIIEALKNEKIQNNDIMPLKICKNKHFYKKRLLNVA
jgi:Transposase DDE domain